MCCGWNFSPFLYTSGKVSLWRSLLSRLVKPNRRTPRGWGAGGRTLPMPPGMPVPWLLSQTPAQALLRRSLTDVIKSAHELTEKLSSTDFVGEPNMITPGLKTRNSDSGKGAQRVPSPRRVRWALCRCCCGVGAPGKGQREAFGAKGGPADSQQGARPHNRRALHLAGPPEANAARRQGDPAEQPACRSANCGPVYAGGVSQSPSSLSFVKGALEN